MPATGTPLYPAASPTAGSHAACGSRAESGAASAVGSPSGSAPPPTALSPALSVVSATSPLPRVSALTHEQERAYKWVVKLTEVEMRTRLGAGAYGEVWAGRWRRNEVAVKQLLTGKLTDEDKDNFLQESDGH